MTALASFDPANERLRFEYEKLTEEEVDYVMSSLTFSQHPIDRIVDIITDNFQELRRDLREVRLNRDAMDLFIEQLQLRIDTSITQDGIGVGNATASAITATGTQEAFNVKRVTGKRAAVGNNKALDIVKGKKDPIDEGTLRSYFKPPTFEDAYYQGEQLRQYHLRDFIKERVTVDTAAELGMPEWYHELFCLNSGHTFEELFSEGIAAGGDRFQYSQKHIFLRLEVDTDIAYRCGVTMAEIASTIEEISLKLPKGMEASIVAIPSHMKDATIDVAIINSPEYEPVKAVAGSKVRVFDENVTQIIHRYILKQIHISVIIKNSPIIRGIEGVTDIEIKRDNVNSAIDDIYMNDDGTRYDLIEVGDEFDDSILQDDAVIHFNRNHNLMPIRKTGKTYGKFLDSLSVGDRLIVESEYEIEGSTPLNRWVIDINADSRIFKSIGVIPILRFLSFYDEVEGRSEYELYLQAYDKIKGNVKLVTSSAILNDPDRYHLTRQRELSNSRLSSFDLYTEYDLKSIRKDIIKKCNDLISPSDYNPLFNISHRTYGKVFYNLLNDPNVDVDMTTYSNGVTVASMLGIGACYTISAFGLRSTLGEGINPQHASMFASHRCVTGNWATLTLTARATPGVGPITACQMNPPVTTFAKNADRRMGESTMTTTGFMSSSFTPSKQDLGAKLDAYGRPFIKGLSDPNEMTPLQLGFKTKGEKIEEEDKGQTLGELLESRARKGIERRVKKLVLDSVKLRTLDKAKQILSTFKYRTVTSRFIHPSLIKS